jgi:hypothetical protein
VPPSLEEVWSGHADSEEVKHTPDDVSQQFSAPLTAGHVLWQSESALQLGVHCPGVVPVSPVDVVPVSPVGVPVPVSAVGNPVPVSPVGATPVSSSLTPLSTSEPGAPESLVKPPELPLQAATSARTIEEVKARERVVITSWSLA